MKQKELVIIADYSQDEPLNIDELCTICHASPQFIENLIDYGIIKPVGSSQKEWVFDLAQLARVKKALRLQHDLEVNVAGIALVLDLLDELEELRGYTSVMEKHIFK